MTPPAVMIADDDRWLRRDDGVYALAGGRYRAIISRRWFGVRIDWYEPKTVVALGPFAIRDTAVWQRAAVTNTLWPHVWWLRWRGRPRLPRAVVLR